MIRKAVGSDQEATLQLVVSPESNVHNVGREVLDLPDLEGDRFLANDSRIRAQ